VRQRYTSIPFPPYAYHPGTETPHPVKDPKGHQFGKPPPSLSDDETFLYGVDLFNHQYYWEAHETWEALWKKYKGDTNEVNFYQSLIQFAACCLKRILDLPEGVEKLKMYAFQKLDRIESKVSPIYHGVDLKKVRSDLANVRMDQEFTPPEIRLRLGPT
jgi:hypothetical protein